MDAVGEIGASASEVLADVSVERLFDLALDLLCVADTDGYFRRVNPAFLRSLGWSEEELLGSPFLDFVHPDDVDATMMAVEQLARRELVVDFVNRYRCVDGSYRWLVWRSMSGDGRLIYAGGRDVTEELQAKAIAEERAAIIDRQSKDIAQAAKVHQTLVQAMVDGADVQDILAAVSGLSDKPAALFSASLGLLHEAYPVRLGPQSNLWPREAASAQVRRLLRSLDGARPSTILPPMPEIGLIVRQLVSRLAVRGEVIGYLAVAELGSPLSAYDAQVVEHSSSVLALALVSRQRQAEAEGQAREDLLNDLLQGGRDPQLLRKRAQAHGLDLDRAHALVRIDYCTGSRPSITGAARRTLISRRISEYLQVGGVLGVGVPGADVMLLPLPDSDRGDVLNRTRAAVVRAITSAGLDDQVRAAVVSSPCLDPLDYARAHRELRMLLESMDPGPTGSRVLLARDLGVMQVVLSAGNSESAQRFSRSVLGPLLDDGIGKEALLTTLRTFVEAGARYRETATRLGVHENTIRYRLHQITKLTGIDPDDLGSLLDARFALQVLSLVDVPARPSPPGSPDFEGSHNHRDRSRFSRTPR